MKLRSSLLNGLQRGFVGDVLCVVHFVPFAGQISADRCNIVGPGPFRAPESRPVPFNAVFVVLQSEARWVDLKVQKFCIDCGASFLRSK